MRWLFTSFVLVLHVLITLTLSGFASVSAGTGRDVSSSTQLTTKELRALARTPDPSTAFNLKSPSSHLSKILIPRAPDTENNTFVRNYLADTLRELNWDVEEDTFVGDTPYGQKRFTNVIATKNPRAPTKLVLAAHFDSKFFPNFPENQFVGATDSAVPCAILLDVAEALDPLFELQYSRLRSEGGEDPDDLTTLQLIFFDGEEAFEDWTHTDSIYGARHLSNLWDTTYAAPHPSRPSDRNPTILETIEHLVLLDLLGAKDPMVASYYDSSDPLFRSLISAEQRLEEAGLFKAARKKKEKSVSGKVEEGTKEKKGVAEPRKEKSKSFFRQEKAHSAFYIEDDHIPFLHRGVSILHLIASPFPRVWHTIKDDASALHAPTMKKWTLLMRVMVAEYLGLRPEVNSTASAMRKRSNGDLLVDLPLGL